MGSIGAAVSQGIETIAEKISKYGVLEGAGNVVRKLNTSELETARSVASKRITSTMNKFNFTVGKNDMVKIGETIYNSGDTVKFRTMGDAIEFLAKNGAGVSLADVPKDQIEESFFKGASNLRQAIYEELIQDQSLSEAAIAKKIKGFGSMIDMLASELPGYGGISSLDDVVTDGSRIGKGIAAVQGYFADPEKGLTRKKVAAGYAGAAIGIRYLSGGDLTHNKQGEKDIAGIPFI